jgi:ribosomal protein S27E
MGRIAQIRVKCPNCGKTTNIFIEESNASSAQVKCEHCRKIFEFKGGMLYEPVGYVMAMPEWAIIQPARAPEPVKAMEPAEVKKSKRWWEFWK